MDARQPAISSGRVVSLWCLHAILLNCEAWVYILRITPCNHFQQAIDFTTESRLLLWSPFQRTDWHVLCHQDKHTIGIPLRWEGCAIDDNYRLFVMQRPSCLLRRRLSHNDWTMVSRQIVLHVRHANVFVVDSSVGLLTAWCAIRCELGDVCY